MEMLWFFFSSRRRHTRWTGDWSSDVCSSDLNTELPRNHFRLGPFSGTRRAQKNESSFHLSAVKKNGDPGDNERGDADIKPHKGAARRRFPATVRSAIKRSSANATLAQKPVVMPLN